MRLKSALTHVFAAAGLLGLAACGPAHKASSEGPAAPSPTGATNLWRIEAINDGKVVKTLDMCADAVVQSTFSRPAPEIGGQPCQVAPGAKTTDGSYAARCRLGGNNYVVSATQTGDLSRDFTVEMSVARQDKNGPTYEQTRRYVKLGACPAGWQAGDSAAPGDKQVVNTLAPSGSARTP